MPRRRPLLLQRLVVLVDHDRRSELGARCPRCRARADHHVDTRRAAAQSFGTVATVSPARDSRIPSSATCSCDGATTRTDPRGSRRIDGRQQGRHHVGTRRETQHATAAIEQRRRGRRGRTERRRTGVIERQPDDGTVGDAVTRNGRIRRRPNEPKPTRQIDELGRRPCPRHLDDRFQDDRLEAIGFGTVGERRRARSPTRRPVGRGGRPGRSCRPPPSLRRSREPDSRRPCRAPRRRAGPWRSTIACAQAPTASMKSSRRASSSHGKPGRPKWPYAADLR